MPIRRKTNSDPKEKWSSYYFSTLEAAIAYGKEESLGIFEIEKKTFEDCRIDDASDKANVVDSSAWYTKDGQMIHSENFPYMFGIRGDLGFGDSSRFENAYIPLQDPFEIGDIVRVVGDSQPAIVQESRLIKGEGEMDDFLYYYHENLERKRKR